MKKRLISLVLALALCFGLTVPASAVDVSGLDAKTAQAYHSILTAEVSKYGLASQSNISGLEYAALEDMDANGTPELIVIRYESVGYNGTAFINIWTMKNGSTVQTVNEEIIPGGALTEASIFLVHKPGQVAVCDSFRWYERDYLMEAPDEEWGEEGPLTFRLHYVDGTTEKISATKVSDMGATWAAFEKAWTMDSIRLSGGLGLWLHDDKAVEAIKQVQAVLASKLPQSTAPAAAPTTSIPSVTAATAGTYAPYTIRGTTYEGPFTITFSAAKVARQTIQIRDYSYVDGGIYTSYETKTVTMVTLRPDTMVTVTGLINEDFVGHMDPVESDGNDRYTLHIAGAYMGVRNGTGRNAFTEELLSGGFISYEDYLFTFDSDSTSVPTTPSTPSSSAFRDVPSNAYYAAPVKWAVSNNITNGTSTTAFSPDRTCTTAEILTFLYRACGEPYQPWENNPYINVSSSDYYFQAALWAAKMGMVSGSTFPAGTPCSRANAVKFIWQAVGSPNPATTARFSDVASSASYARAVSWAVGAGVTNGTGTTTFSPNDTCTRGQIVTFLYRAANT